MENRFLDIHKVVSEMTIETEKNIRELSTWQALTLAILAGIFITFGALFSVLISAGVETVGIALLLQGFGFSVGHGEAWEHPFISVYEPFTSIEGKSISSIKSFADENENREFAGSAHYALIGA